MPSHPPPATPTPSTLPWRIAAAGLVVLVLALQVWAVLGQSFVWDEPYHLLAGRQSLCRGTNTLNLEHPPLVKWLGAMPLGCEGVAGENLLPAEALVQARGLFSEGDTIEKGRLWSRWGVWLATGLPFLVFCYLLGYQVGGSRAGLALLLLTGLSIGVIPYLGLVNTDAVVALGFVATAWAALRYRAAPTRKSVAVLGLCFGIALAGKHSGVLLAPVVPLAVWLAWRDGGLGQRARLLLDPLLAFAIAGSVLLGTYAFANRDYDPEAGRASLEQYVQGEATLVTEDRLLGWGDTVMSIERGSPGLAQWGVGFLGIRAQDEIGIYPSYAFGRVSSEGRWWYFPAVLGVKVSWWIWLATVLAGIEWLWRWREKPGPRSTPGIAILLAVPAIYLLVAVTSSYNLGVRHLVPVLPFLFLPAARFLARRPRAGAAVALALAIEALLVAPLWMSSTNTWFLGKHDPFDAQLADSNFDYGQGWVTLAEELRDRGIREVRVLHPVVSGPELRHYLPNARLVAPGDEIGPGRYVVGRILDQYDRALREHGFAEIYGGESLETLVKGYRPLLEALERDGTDSGEIAGVFRLVEVP